MTPCRYDASSSLRFLFWAVIGAGSSSGCHEDSCVKENRGIEKKLVFGLGENNYIGQSDSIKHNFEYYMHQSSGQ